MMTARWQNGCKIPDKRDWSERSDTFCDDPELSAISLSDSKAYQHQDNASQCGSALCLARLVSPLKLQ